MEERGKRGEERRGGRMGGGEDGKRQGRQTGIDRRLIFSATAASHLRGDGRRDVSKIQHKGE